MPSDYSSRLKAYTYMLYILRMWQFPSIFDLLNVDRVMITVCVCSHVLSVAEDDERRASLRGGKCAAVVHTAKQLSRTYRVAAEQRTVVQSSPVQCGHQQQTRTAQEAASARLSTLDWPGGRPTVVNSRQRNEAIHHALMGKSNALVVTPTGLLINPYYNYDKT